MAGRTLWTMFEETVQRHGEQPAVGFRKAKGAEITYWTYRELAERVRAFRRGLDTLGLRRGDRFAILSENRVEWAVADLAGQSLGLVTVSPYTTLPPSQVAYILRDAGAKAAVVSDAKQRAKIREVRGEAPELAFVIAMEGEPERLETEDIFSWEAILQRGKDQGRPEAELDALSAEGDPEDLATLIYTSGTTGDPKGAMLTHRNMLQTPDDVVNEPIAELGPGDTFLSFLPLSHITERAAGHYLPFRAGACIVYSQGLSSIGEEITTSVRPTAMLFVPRLWENIYDKFQDALAKRTDKDRSRVQWALRVGSEVAQRLSDGKGIGIPLKVQHLLAEKLILSKVREKLTGGRMRYCVSGGAPLDPEIGRFFLAIGIPMMEGYGLSETCVTHVNRRGHQRIGYVGTKLKNVEIKFAEDGEILMRGQGRMRGYWNQPQATAEAIDSEGWFHTGDIGEETPDGYLKITDRKKDLIVMTNGKKVAPLPIESTLKHSPFIGESVLFGDRQSTITAIIVPAFDKLLAWAKSQELPTKDIPELLAHADVQKLYRGEIDKLTPHLADYEKIKRFKLAPQPFSIEGGELTPTLKVKRRFVAQKYAELIASMSH